MKVYINEFWMVRDTFSALAIEEDRPVYIDEQHVTPHQTPEGALGHGQLCKENAPDNDVVVEHWVLDTERGDGTFELHKTTVIKGGD